MLLQQLPASLVQEPLLTASKVPAKPVFIYLLYWLGFAPKRLLEGVQTSPHSSKAELLSSHLYLRRKWESTLLSLGPRGNF